MNPINLSIDGIPASKGDWIGVGKKYIPQNKEKLYAWTHAIRQAAIVAYSPAAPSQAAIELKIKFFMPASRNKGPCITRPDLDKLTRAVMDAFQGIIYVDDSQVIRLIAEKEYALIEGCEGAEIEIKEA